MQTKHLNITVVGAGLIGMDHIALIQNTPISQLTGICDISDSAIALAARAGTSFYRDLAQLIQTEKPDGIIIASPNGLHAEHARVCAENGIPILIEKPIAGTLSDARQIEHLVEVHNARILVGHYRRYNPIVERTRILLQQGVIGKPVGVSVLWSAMKPDNYYATQWRVERPNGGPALINLIHDIDMLRYMLGDIATVFTHSSSATRQLAVEDTLSISLQFENGTLGTILVSDTAPSPWSYEATIKERDFFAHSDENCYFFIGTAGSFGFPKLDIWRYPPDSPANWQHPLEHTAADVERASPMQLQFEHFLRVIQGKEDPQITAADGTRSLATVFSILQSAEQNRPIAVDDVYSDFS